MVDPEETTNNGSNGTCAFSKMPKCVAYINNRNPKFGTATTKNKVTREHRIQKLEDVYDFV